jgi:Ca-activated chloride channel homolog
MRRSFILVSVLALPFLTLLAQTPAKQTPFKVEVDVELVQLHVAVTDKEGRMIPALTEENFQVFEDNVLQDISLFRHEDIPLSMGLVIDNSGSMRPNIDRVRSAALAFVKESNPDDETFVVAFDNDAWLEQDFTGSLGDLVDALDNLNPKLQTALHDAIYLSIDHVKTGQLEKKALLIISDGEDTASKWGYNKVLEHVRQAKDVTIFAIGMLDQNDQRSGGLFGRNAPQKKAREALTEIATVTGGQAFFPKSIDEVEEICKRIARDLRNQYTLGYTPKNTKLDGTWRTLRVEVKPPPKTPKLTVRAKEGYQAPDRNASSAAPQKP